MADARTQYERYIAAVGAVTHAWNFLHERLGRLFVTLLNLNLFVGFALWYSTENDRMQRDMLMAVVSQTYLLDLLPRWPTAREDIIWLLTRANSLADSRNNAIHTPIDILISNGGEHVPSALTHAYFMGHRRALRMADKDILQELEWCKQYADVLSNFAHEITYVLDRHLRDGRRRDAWPRRPSVPDRPPKTAR